MADFEQVTGAEVQEAAAPETTATEPVNPTSEGQTAESTVETAENTTEAPTADGKTEEDSRFASVRRKAEEEARAKYGAETQKYNERIRQMCAGKTHPDTGKPIETLEDYFDALEAQERNAMNEELRAKGIDPKLIEDMVNNSPVVRQANAVMQMNMQAEAQRQLEEDIKVLSKIDPSIKTVNDLTSHSSYQQVFDLVSKHGLSLVDAYKLANYETLAAKSNAAAKQAAINQAKGKNHMEATGSGHSSNDELAEVPASLEATWKNMNPGLTESEIRVKYNEFLKNTGGK